MRVDAGLRWESSRYSDLEDPEPDTYPSRPHPFRRLSRLILGAFSASSQRVTRRFRRATRVLDESVPSLASAAVSSLTTPDATCEIDAACLSWRRRNDDDDDFEDSFLLLKPKD